MMKIYLIGTPKSYGEIIIPVLYYLLIRVGREGSELTNHGEKLNFDAYEFVDLNPKSNKREYKLDKLKQ